MYCTHCGTQNAEGAQNCVSCAQLLPPSPGAVSNFLAPAILVTLCCCVPFGIPAIVFASQVNSKLAAGDVAGAMECSRKAKMWTLIAFGLGAAGSLIWIGMAAISALSEM